MATYTVIWEIDIEADSPKEAAIKAREYQLDPESTATVFKVDQDHNSSIYYSGGWHEFDLSLNQENNHG
jgi:polyisoprenoid-binding protein YceI